MPGLALDIDNVLCATNIYWAEELQKIAGNPENLTPQEISDKYVLADKVPYWQTPDALAWMHKARTLNEFSDNLGLIENADHVVNKIHRLIPIVAYITARWETLRESTESWLWRHEFPAAPVYMRPMQATAIKGYEWKAEFLSSHYPGIVGIVDDERRVVEHLPRDYPGTVFLYKNPLHLETDVDVVLCKDWDAVLQAVTERYTT